LVLQRLAASRGQGSAADGLVSAGVDGTGEIVELVIEPRAMRMASSDLAEAVRTAIAAARADVTAQLAVAAPQSTPDTGVAALHRLLRDVDASARQQMQQFARFADELTARLGGK
jgi:DNA-binding protein YbaB